jgi:hypothetical protein
MEGIDEMDDFYPYILTPWISKKAFVKEFPASAR